MVSWDSKERGIRLADCCTVRGVYLGCSACNRHVGVEITEAVRAFGDRIYLRDLAQRLRCSDCGARKGYVMTWAHPPG